MYYKIFIPFIKFVYLVFRNNFILILTHCMVLCLWRRGAPCLWRRAMARIYINIISHPTPFRRKAPPNPYLLKKIYCLFIHGEKRRTMLRVRKMLVSIAPVAESPENSKQLFL